MSPWFGVLLAAAGYTVVKDGVAVRESCGAREREVAQLDRGTPVEIRFSVNGDSGMCYKVVAITEGRKIQGYLEAGEIQGLDQYEKERSSAPPVRVTGTGRPGPARTAAGRGQLILEQPRQPAPGGGASGGGLDERVRKAAALMKANQPGEALTMLEPVLAAEPKNASLLAMAGQAALQSDNPRRAIELWEQSLAIQPNPPVARLLDQAKRELASDSSSEKLVGAQFTFRYDSKDITPERARSLVPLLDIEFARLSSQLGCQNSERIVAVVQSRDAYLKSTGAAEWSAAMYDGRIRVSLLDGDQAGEQTRRSLAHELVHACLARTGNWPAWLHEGLAQKLSGEPVNFAARARVKDATTRGDMPSLARLGHTYSRMSAQHAEMAYAAAHLAADYLFEVYGADGVRNLVQNPSMLSQVTATLDAKIRER
jgi:tetratricopeptide (TPR) repeat protein